MHKTPKIGPIGKGFVLEVKTKQGSRFVARWNAYILDEQGQQSIGNTTETPFLILFSASARLPMSEIADREFSEWVAKKSFTYVKAILDTARDLGITKGNAARNKHRRIPKGVKKSKSFAS